MWRGSVFQFTTLTKILPVNKKASESYDKKESIKMWIGPLTR